MKSQQLEAWVLSIVDQVKAGNLVEDSRVELKSEWPDAQKAARRLAAHANAARGESVLWVVGLDEKRGVVPLQQTDFAIWYQQVSKEFEGIAPQLYELIVPTQDGQVIAILVETLRAPYVVRNPFFGTTNGGSIQYEVPWREGTKVRSARRDDLIRLLVPMQALPFLEVLNASITLEAKDAIGPIYANQVPPTQHVPHFLWELYLSLYLTPQTADRVVFPIHKATFTYRSGSDTADSQFGDLRFYTPCIHTGPGSSRLDSHTVLTTSSEAIIDGPGIVKVSASFIEVPRAVTDEELILNIGMIPASNNQALTTVLTLVQREFGSRKSWGLPKDESD